jgi:UDP-glucose 4-epimerase
VNELVGLLGGPIVHIPRRPGEPDCTFADTARIGRELNWKPKVKFADGVGEMLKHIDYWRDAPIWTPASIEKATAGWFKYLGRNAS